MSVQHVSALTSDWQPPRGWSFDSNVTLLDGDGATKEGGIAAATMRRYLNDPDAVRGTSYRVVARSAWIRQRRLWDDPELNEQWMALLQSPGSGIYYGDRIYRREFTVEVRLGD